MDKNFYSYKHLTVLLFSIKNTLRVDLINEKNQDIFIL